ncbi:MAG: glycosyltransferase family 4 protein [Alphaproteobacteria bacterium]|nr:MAG: glycosyltransferase family 4 protein [Alphaproteobacteria bacterium]
MSNETTRPGGEVVAFARPLTALIVAPTLHAGAADAGAIDLVRILTGNGHRAIVVSNGGRLEDEVAAAGAEFIRLDVADFNPIFILRAAFALARIVRARRCDVIHAHGRAAAWAGHAAARMTGVPLITTWYKGYREQNVFKRLYNSAMVRGERVIAVSDQIAELIAERYALAPDRIAVVPASIDMTRFDPAAISADRLDVIRRAWGVAPDTKVILVVGRMLRRKGHHVAVKAVHRLKERGLKDFVCVFVGEDQGRTRYTGELWDLISSTGTTDVVRFAGEADDIPAAYAAATVVVSAAVQPEGLQRAILEAQAMARPVVVSDLAAGPEVVLAPPTVAEDRMTGLRVPAGDEAALAAALIRLFSLSDTARAAIGARGRSWVAAQFDPASIARATLELYAAVARARQPR